MNTTECTIIGDGAIGLWFARALHNDFAITLALRNSTKTHTNYHFTELDGAEFSLSLNTQPLHASQTIRTAILPLKAYQIEPAFQQIHAKLADDACILLSHNGLGTIDKILPRLGRKQTLLFMTTTEGALKTDKYDWQHTGKGQSVIAALNTKNTAAQHLIDVLTKHEAISESTNILPMLWRKLAINCAINPLTAIHQVQNGALAAPEFQKVIAQICAEVVAVADSQQIPLDLDEIIYTVHQVINNTSKNYSSMNRDIAAQRRTEISAINGYICQLATQQSLAVPANQSLVDKIEKLTQ